jgi:hypothetical protein
LTSLTKVFTLLIVSSNTHNVALTISKESDGMIELDGEGDGGDEELIPLN